jgi:hypothetical protein
LVDFSKKVAIFAHPAIAKISTFQQTALNDSETALAINLYQRKE